MFGMINRRKTYKLAYLTIVYQRSCISLLDSRSLQGRAGNSSLLPVRLSSRPKPPGVGMSGITKMSECISLETFGLVNIEKRRFRRISRWCNMARDCFVRSAPSQ
jgi:hypothetical protein